MVAFYFTRLAPHESVHGKNLFFYPAGEFDLRTHLRVDHTPLLELLDLCRNAADIDDADSA